MYKINCLIVDDEAPARRVIENYLNKIDSAVITGSVQNAVEAYNLLQNNKIDIIFLDINMPEISGVALLNMLQVPPIVILTTAYSEFGVVSYDYNVVDYLLKPIRFDRFLKAYDRAINMLGNQKLITETRIINDNFEFIVDKENKCIPVNEIRYLQSFGNYIKIFTGQNKNYLTLLTTKEAEEKLGKFQFIRIHKSFIVNINEIVNYETDSITLSDNNDKLPIGKIYRKYFIEAIKNRKLK